MARSNISFLNKNGYSMFWNSMWDNKINYNKYLKEDLFLKHILFYLLKDNISKNLFIFKKLNLKNSNKYKNHKKYKQMLNYHSNIEFYSFKFWILRYQNWIIIYNYIFISNFKNIKFFIKFDNNLKNLNFFKFYKLSLKSYFFKVNNYFF